VATKTKNIHFTKKLKVMKQELVQLIQNLESMKFSQNFIDELYGPEDKYFSQFTDACTEVTIEVHENLKKVKCKADMVVLHSYFNKYKKNQLIYKCDKFAVYRELRYIKYLESRIKESTIVLVKNDAIKGRFYCCEEDLIVIETNDILFLSFPRKRETIGIINLDVLFVTFLPFAITSSDSDEVTLECGLKARVSLERVDYIHLFVNFTF
jgi:hypothetical protein